MTCAYGGRMLGAAAGGGGVTEVVNFTDLPATADNGEVYRVTDPDQRAEYRYLATVGGTAFGMWVPRWLSYKISDYVRDSSSNPCKISAGIGGDDVATITGRGWVDGSVNGIVSDVGSTIQLASAGASSRAARLDFAPDPIGDLADRQIFMVLEIDIISIGSAASGMAIDMRVSASSLQRLAWDTGAQRALFDNSGWTRPGGTAERLVAGTTAFATSYCLWGAQDDQSRKTFWTGENGLVAIGDPAEFVNSDRDLGGTADDTFRVFTRGDASGNTMQVRELHVFRLAA